MDGRIDRDALFRVARERPEMERLNMAEVNFFIGQQAYARGQHEEALKWFKRAVETEAVPYREVTFARMQIERNTIATRAFSKNELPITVAQAAQATIPVPKLIPTALPTSSSVLVPPAIASGKGPQTGDEWEYLARDNLFGKQKRLLWRVKTVDSFGVMEELVVDGKPSLQWAFKNKPDLIAVPIDAGFLLGQHWDGRALPVLTVSGVGDCVAKFSCTVRAKVAGYERITVPAGTFDAVRIDGDLNIKLSAVAFSGPVSFWYSEKSRRLLKQTVNVRNSGFNVDETLELQAARTNQ
jgi:hypothetical protein